MISWALTFLIIAIIAGCIRIVRCCWHSEQYCLDSICSGPSPRLDIFYYRA